MNLSLTNAQIARILRVPEHNVEEQWPVILICLKAVTMASKFSQIASLATIAVETAFTFKPIAELGGDKYLRSKKYYPYYGRGVGQITWQDAYEKYGKLLGIDLVGHPELALDTNVSASVFAAQWRDKHCDLFADTGQFTTVRKKWNGGTNGLPEFLHLVNELIEADKEAEIVRGNV